MFHSATPIPLCRTQTLIKRLLQGDPTIIDNLESDMNTIVGDAEKLLHSKQLNQVKQKIEVKYAVMGVQVGCDTSAVGVQTEEVKVLEISEVSEVSDSINNQVNHNEIIPSEKSGESEAKLRALLAIGSSINGRRLPNKVETRSVATSPIIMSPRRCRDINSVRSGTRSPSAVSGRSPSVSSRQTTHRSPPRWIHPPARSTAYEK